MISLYWTFLLLLCVHTFMHVCVCVTGTQQSWTNCAQSMQVWWKSWQTATASCSRRSTRGSRWRSTISRTCPSWRYSHPDAQRLLSLCFDFLQPKQKLAKPKNTCPAQPQIWLGGGTVFLGKWVEIIVESLGWGVGKRSRGATIVLALDIFSDRHSRSFPVTDLWAFMDFHLFPYLFITCLEQFVDRQHLSI